ncbi:MAG TPA: beta-N-acetylhexosaminidase [Ohtaekwangia sp.]|nr:beta-N-acetylhexosaminidase [Ohtaekwangia sp.]
MAQIKFILRNRIQFSLITLMLLQFFLVGCNKSVETSPEAKLAFESLIPKPVSAEATGKAFFITAETEIHVAEEHLVKAGEFLAGKLRPATGFALEVSVNSEKADKGILLNLSGEATLGEEGYTITILEDGLTLSAHKPAGLIRGIQTIRQLLPAGIELNTVQQASWEIATGTITDYPQYVWRGAMLDVARHFFTVDEVKRYIDLISYYKINILHLHLSDDQGWRIEIKSWPNLTKIGGSTEVGGGEGGFYTQAEYADIVAYAQDHYITIVPEIDMPGHTNAALASYPELNEGPSINLEASPTKPVAGKLYTGVEVGFSTLHIKKEITLKFVEDIVRELASITPGPYLHIGGDEAAVTKKDDYIQFINQFKTIVESHGKKMVGWEEIAQGDIDDNVMVQYWHAEKYANMAVDKGAKLILSPSKKVYLDMQYDSTSRIGLHWAAYIEVDSSYQWDPASYINGVSAEHIAGVEAPLWTETVQTMDDIEYLVFPRLPGVAEIGWSAAAARDWDTYKVRLGNQAKRWKNMEIDYYPSSVVPWQN